MLINIKSTKTIKTCYFQQCSAFTVVLNPSAVSQVPYSLLLLTLLILVFPAVKHPLSAIKPYYIGFLNFLIALAFNL
jgi:hypothetical protein